MIRAGKKKYAAVLGCGPAGLLAALAAKRLGYEVDIYSRKVPSPLYGAQYLHKPVPELSHPNGVDIEYRLRGTVEEYARKVYGQSKRMPELVSPAHLVGSHKAWDLRSAYHKLWGYFEDGITDVGLVAAHDVQDLLYARNYKRVISSIPAHNLCFSSSHEFSSESVWTSGDAPEENRWSPVKTEPWTVICDGTEDVSWYRASNVFGHNTVEWARDDKPPVDNVSKVVKPISTNCDCLADVLRVGRYGEWKKGVLSHEAYEKVLKEL